MTDPDREEAPKPERPAGNDSEPPKRRSKRTRAKSSSRETGAATHAEPEAVERPAFIEGFPDHPELAKLSRAFENGDYAYVREHAPRLAREVDDDEVRRAALELVERIKPDPLLKYMLALSVALLLYLVLHAYGGQGH